MPLRDAGVPGHDARAEAVNGFGAGPGGLAIEHVRNTGSTSSDLLDRVRDAAAAGGNRFPACLRVADRQSAGRGRHGRAWHAAPGASLTFSLAWQFARADLSGLSLAVGAVLADTLGAGGAGHRIGLKWPNDLWLVDAGPAFAACDAGHRVMPAAGGAPCGRKLAGVLIETGPLGSSRVAVIGIGINVGALAVADAASGVAWLAEIDAAATTASTLDRVAAPLVAALHEFADHGFAPFAARFSARDLLLGRHVIAGAGAAAVDGRAAGVSASGELLVQTSAGTVAISSGEVRVRIAGAGGDPSSSASAAQPLHAEPAAARSGRPAGPAC